MKDPRALVPESVMPAYPWLAETRLDFLKNGSFQVVRKLAQDVGRFRDILSANADVPDLAERMMGRPLAKDDPLSTAAESESPQYFSDSCGLLPITSEVLVEDVVEPGLAGVGGQGERPVFAVDDVFALFFKNS